MLRSGFWAGWIQPNVSSEHSSIQGIFHSISNPSVDLLNFISNSNELEI
jgi:hypothetical protein